MGEQDAGLALLPPGASLVEIDLEGKGCATVQLRHSRLPANLTDRHGERWSFYLTNSGAFRRAAFSASIGFAAGTVSR